MRRITALWESFFSRNFYSEVFHNWKGIGILVLLIPIILHTAVVFAKIHFSLQDFVHDIAPPVVKQIPPITFKNGVASTPEAIAYEITEPESGELVAIIDTRVPQPPPDLGGARIFVASERVVINKNHVEQRSYDYKSLDNFTLGQEQINFWLGIFGNLTALFCSPFVFGFLVVWRLIQLLLFSLVTLLVCAMCGLVGSYSAKLRLTAAALVPGMVLSLILSALRIDFPGMGLVLSAIVAGYIVFGVTAARKSVVSSF